MARPPPPNFARSRRALLPFLACLRARLTAAHACPIPVRDTSAGEPAMTTVGSQDTTGPMTRDELKDLACLGFLADLTMQSFCHTAAYPKPGGRLVARSRLAALGLLCEELRRALARLVVRRSRRRQSRAACRR